MYKQEKPVGRVVTVRMVMESVRLRLRWLMMVDDGAAHDGQRTKDYFKPVPFQRASQRVGSFSEGYRNHYLPLAVII